MKVAGIITEYNPFHNGHKFHIDETRKITGADYIVAVMSGNYVQRGTPAFLDKYSRTRMALNNGVDIVLELPVCSATGSAEYFATGAVSLLNQLGIVDTLCFGSECGDITLLKETASLLMDALPLWEERLYAYIKEGFTYPAARLKTVKYYLGTSKASNELAKLSDILSEPNNILGLEYLKALIKLPSCIKPITISRKTAQYHDMDLTNRKPTAAPIYQLFSSNLSEHTGNGMPVISSATAIRNSIQSIESVFDFPVIKNSVPRDVYDFMMNNFCKSYPITEEDFSQIIKYKLLSEDRSSLTDYVDITSDLADRMANLRDIDISIAELTKLIKTKNLTHTRINRALVHLLLNIKNDTLKEYLGNGYTFYARVLGIRKEATHLLRKISDSVQIPVITKVSKAEEQLDTLGRKMLSEDLFATHIYNQAVYEKYGTSIPSEYKHGIIIQ